MYSCGTPASQQIVIYETTNIIDNFLLSKPLCTSWNGGYAIQALHNITGTLATVVPGRNFPTQWTAANEARRYTPAGAPMTTMTWWQGVTQIGTGASIVVCPTTTTTYTAQVNVAGCTAIVITDLVTVNVSPPPIITVTPNPTSICIGGCRTLTASGAIT